MGYFDGLLRYFEFSGRTTRTQLLTYYLGVILVTSLAMFIDYKLTGRLVAVDPTPHKQLLNHLGPFLAFSLFFHAIPSITVTVRRFHDMGRSGWWLLVPLVNMFMLLGSFFGADYGPNSFGDDPRDEVKPHRPKPAKDGGPRRFRGVRYNSPSRPPNYDPTSAQTGRFI